MIRTQSFLRGAASALGLISLALYVASLTLSAFRCPEQYPSFIGYEVLLYGMSALLSFDLRWLGNLAYFVLLLYSMPLPNMRSTELHVIAMTSAVAAALFSLLPAPGCAGDSWMRPSEAPGPGAIYWIVALLLVSIASILPKIGSSDGVATKV